MSKNAQHEAIRIEFDVPVPMRDGTVLRADVYSPAAEGSYPVLVTRHPYDKSAPHADVYVDSKKSVRAGYIVVQQDSRGRFESEGEWLPWKYEREDGFDTIEWAAALPNSNGRVGMFGGSYLGSTQWSAAISQAPHLRAIAPAITWSDPEDGLMFSRRRNRIRTQYMVEPSYGIRSDSESDARPRDYDEDVAGEPSQLRHVGY